MAVFSVWRLSSPHIECGEQDDDGIDDGGYYRQNQYVNAYAVREGGIVDEAIEHRAAQGVD